MQTHRNDTRQLAKGLKWEQVYHWLIEHGYFPESYVLPPCFRVSQHPDRPKRFASVASSPRSRNFTIDFKLPAGLEIEHV